MRNMNLEDNHSFIIRIWENVEGKGSHSNEAWRGSIDYVGSDKRLYFNDINSIAAFIREQILSDDTQPVTRWDLMVERFKVGRRVRAFWRLVAQRWLGLLHRKPSDLYNHREN